MHVFLDLTSAKHYASSEVELMSLALTFEISLGDEVEFFKSTLNSLSGDDAGSQSSSEVGSPKSSLNKGNLKKSSLKKSFLNSEVLKEIKVHFHQLIGFLPLFTAPRTLDEIKTLIKLVINDSSTGTPESFYESWARLQEILEGLQNELQDWKASYHLSSL